MPREWHDRHAANKIEDEDERAFYRSIVACKKPYFMRYIYPALMKQYNTYLRNTNRNALREFQMTVQELRALPYNDLNERQKEFLRYYDYRMPVGVHSCIMNKICRRFEDEFDGYIGKHNPNVKFDYHFMRNSTEYSARQFNAIRRLYEDYNKRLASYAIFSNCERIDEYESFAALSMINDDFRRECNIACSDRDVLCNIILDICYKKSSTRRFAWSMCGSEIIRTLLIKNENKISFPALSADGDIEYGGQRFVEKTTTIEVNE